MRSVAVLLAAAVLARAGSDARFFDDRVAPILSRRCLSCHNHELDDGDISFEDRATLLKPRAKGGPAVAPRHPEKSAMIQAVKGQGEFQMPPGKPLPASEIRTLTEWVKRGAAWGSKLRAQ